MLTKNEQNIAIFKPSEEKLRSDSAPQKAKKPTKSDQKFAQTAQTEEKLRRGCAALKVNNSGDFDQIIEKLRGLSVPYIPVRQVAEMLGNDKKTILEWCAKRLIMAEEVPYGTKTTYKIKPQAVILFLESQKTLAETAKKQMDDHIPFVSGWIEAMKKGMVAGVKGSYSEHTIVNYGPRINKYLQTYSAITYQNVKEHLKTFEDRTSNKVQEYRALNCFTRYLYSEDALDDYNYEKITGKDLRPQGNPTPKRLRVAYQDYRTMILKGGGSLTDRVILHILFHTGMRASEFCGIKVENLNFEKQELFIPKAKGHKQRLLGLNRVAFAAFVKYLKHCPKKEGEYLFLDILGQQMVKSGLYARVKRIARNAGLDKSKIHPHAFRRSFGTFNLQKGRSVKSVQLALGHSKPSVTLEIYDTTTQQEVANMMKNW
ncbi:MAG: tyrosine-type recombinase/integrase [Candidatus Melainabacteria bacterium]